MNALTSVFIVMTTFLQFFLTTNINAKNSSDPLKIIGENDLINVPSTYADLSEVKAIGRMRLGCTVTHVGKGIAITAGHCLSASSFEGVRNDQKCSSSRYNVRWGVTYGSRGYMTSKCLRVIAIENNSERDYAVLFFDPIPEGFIRVDFAQETKKGDEISIFSHPRKRPLEWSNWCEVDTFFDKSKGNQFGYDCDTEGGSSGAAVLNSNMQVVGIHNFYHGSSNRNGATKITSTPLKYILRGGGMTLSAHHLM